MPKFSQGVRKHSEETKAKISASMKGRKCIERSAEHRRKLSEARKGREMGPHSEKTKEKMSAAHKDLSAEARANQLVGQQAQSNRMRVGVGNELPIGTVFREIRHELGMTQRQIAPILGLSWSAISHWERRATTPSVKSAVNYHDYLVSISRADLAARLIPYCRRGMDI